MSVTHFGPHYKDQYPTGRGLDLLISIIEGTEGGFILLAAPQQDENISGKCAKHPPVALGLPSSLTPGCPAAQCPLMAQEHPAVTVVSSTVPSKQCFIPALREARVPQVTALAGTFLQLSESLGV